MIEHKVEVADRWFRPFLVCPDCRAPLRTLDDGFHCTSCEYQSANQRPLDLRPRHPKPVVLSFTPRRTAYLPHDLGQLPVSRPEVTVERQTLSRDSRELLSAMAPFLPTGARVLDLGCGPRDQFDPIHRLGWQYVGSDYEGSAADVLADAHALPFADGVFDAVLSFAVLEHLYHPYVAVSEVCRVLKPGGVYCGTVSQGDPYHSSFFNMTPWGVLSLLESLELLPLRLWPNYDTLFSLSVMGRYPRVIKSLLRFVAKFHEAAPFLAPRRMRWPSRLKEVDELYRSAAIVFLAQKAA